MSAQDTLRRIEQEHVALRAAGRHPRRRVWTRRPYAPPSSFADLWRTAATVACIPVLLWPEPLTAAGQLLTIAAFGWLVWQVLTHLDLNAPRG